MLHDTPLRKCHQAYVAEEAARGTSAASGEHRPGAATGFRLEDVDIEYVPYGPPTGGRRADCALPATFGSVEAEYAAIRNGAGLLDSPHRGTLFVRGRDGRSFLNRMLTQELKGLENGGTASSFVLNRKGRIDADVVVAALGDDIVIDIDLHQAASTAEGLGRFVIADEVEIVDRSAEFHHVALHGPGALPVVASAAREMAVGDLEPRSARRVAIAGIEVMLVRRDQTGAPGVEIIVPRGAAETVWNALLETGPRRGRGRRIRPIGWFAFNTARIEAGEALFNIDFGPSNLPHETGVLDSRVSFVKGCFLGQEIVARMQSHAGPRQMLVGLRMEDDRLPVAEAQVFAGDGESVGERVGVVTSSTVSPMLGSRPIAFAMLRAAAAAAGSTVLVDVEGERARATVTGLDHLDSREGRGR